MAGGAASKGASEGGTPAGQGTPPPPGLWRRLLGRRWIQAVLILGIVGAALAPVGLRQWHAIKTDPQFCVSCHLMEEAGHKWTTSAHKDVICQSCHRADLFEEARFGFNAYVLRKKEIGTHTKLPVTICLECHLVKDTRWAQISSSKGHATHALNREIGCLTCHVTQLHDFRADLNACLQCHGQKLTLSRMEGLHCVGCHDFFGEGKRNLLPTKETCRQCHSPAERPTPLLTAAGIAAKAGAPAPPVAPRAPAPEAVTVTSAAPGLPALPAKVVAPRVSPKSPLVLTKAAGPSAPTWKGHEDCTGCHRPHGAPLEDPLDCLKCHSKMLDPDSRHYRDWRLQKCRECHDPHGKA